MPSPRSSAQNLARWRKRVGMRTANESLAIKQCIWQWGLLSPDHRRPATQAELAKALGVSRAYVSKIMKRLLFEAPIDSLTASPVTPAHVVAMRQRQEQFCRQQDEDSRQAAERWEEAGRDEEANARREGWWPEQVIGDTSLSEDSENTEDAEWRKFDEEVRRAVSPWPSKDKLP